MRSERSIFYAVGDVAASHRCNKNVRCADQHSKDMHVSSYREDAADARCFDTYSSHGCTGKGMTGNCSDMLPLQRQRIDANMAMLRRLGLFRLMGLRNCDDGQAPMSSAGCNTWVQKCCRNPLAICMSSSGPPRCTTTTHRCHEPSSPMHSISNDQHRCDCSCTGPERTSCVHLVEGSRAFFRTLTCELT
jgi:hypothetical protein